jgi:predicted TIM-barrel enzyme/transcriptional regulator with AAA-type ATPase domain
MTTQTRPFLVGAAVGNGMAALAAERGGADFLLALNAGRFRAMGLPSISSILPLRDSNRMVTDFAEEEILGRVGLPVFLGIAAQDRKADLSAMVSAAAEAGFAGIANFPTVAWIDGRVRSALEQAGMGMAPEIGLLDLARRRGLRTIAYACTQDEACAFADIGASIINLNFGWNASGQDGRAPRQELEEVAGYARHVFKAVRARHPGVICSIEGGPIIRPDHLVEVCRLAEADAYIGGSTIDRLPTETSIAETTARFKAVWSVRGKLSDAAGSGNGRMLAGQSPASRELQSALAGLSGDHAPVLIVGEAGSGKRAAALSLHHRAHGPKAPVEIDLTGRTPDEQLRLLFGSAETGRRQLGWLDWPDAGSVIVRGLLSAPAACQRRLADLVASSEKSGAARPRLIMLHTPRKGADPREQIRRLPALLRRQTLHIPPLRARAGDIVDTAEEMLAGMEGGGALTAEARRLLLQYDWPGNLAELREVLAAAAQASDGLIGQEVVRPLLHPGSGHAVSKRLFDTEREWILHGLSVNGFRRSQTAVFLGMARKTLYNKMKHYDIS